MARLQEFPATVCSRSDGKHDRWLRHCSNSEQTAKCNGRCESIMSNRGGVLTLSDVLPCPLVILEERMPLDLIDTITAKSNFSAGVREDMLSFILDHFNSV